MNMAPHELREIMHRLGISQAELSRWLGQPGRTIRRYVAKPESANARAISPAMALLFRMLSERPELVALARRLTE